MCDASGLFAIMLPGVEVAIPCIGILLLGWVGALGAQAASRIKMIRARIEVFLMNPLRTGVL
jgi:hypothetical protein